MMSKKRFDKKKRRAKRRQQMRPRQHTSDRRLPDRAPDELDLMAQLDVALADAHPLPMLEHVSALLTIVDPRCQNPFEPKNDDAMTFEDLLESFMSVDVRQTSAVLAVMATFTSDELQAARIRRELSTRRWELPDWLERLTDFERYHVTEMIHVLGDGDNIMIGARTPFGHEFTAVVYIDHNVGTLVKDAFLVDQPIDDVIRLFDSKVGDPDTTWRALDEADARVRVTEAIETAARTYPPFESETWPACRPLVEWLVRGLPPGGQGYVRPMWDEADQLRLIDDFFGSTFGAAIDDEDNRGLLEALVWFGAGYGPGDPLRWSAVAVEILLIDWIPRQIVAEVPYLAKVPPLLRAFIRYSHAERGIRAPLTEQTLAAVDLYETQYQAAIRTPGRQGPAALLERAGLLTSDDDLIEPFDLSPEAYHARFAERLMASLRDAVGGAEALRSLGTQPLPDEDFDWTVVPDDVRERVAEVLALCDRCCEQMLDTEQRTACRRLLAQVVAGDPDVFRRKGAARTAAAAICWIIGKANDVFSPWGGGLQVQEMMKHFDINGSVSQRANVMLRAAGINASRAPEMALGSTDLLGSPRRAKIVEARDRWA